MVVSDASANAARNSCWFLSESAVTEADQTLATNVGAVFPYWVDVHIDQWMYPELINWVVPSVMLRCVDSLALHLRPRYRFLTPIRGCDIRGGEKLSNCWTTACLSLGAHCSLS